MDGAETQIFLDAWHSAMLTGAIIMVTVATLIFLVYHLRVSSIADFKTKHDFISANEIRWYKWVFYSLGIAVVMFINIYGMGKFDRMGVWFYVRIFFSIAGGTVVGYISALILEYYYPTKLNTKLRKWRYMPRVNPKNGSKMKLLSEDEEDVHLDEGMQSEENVFSIDYDVWIDEATKDIKIEKYQGHLTALRCNNCGFYTMKVVKEEIVERNEDGSPRELLKNYQCSYCKNVRATQFHISKREAEDFKNMKPKSKRTPRSVELVKIEIHAGHQEKRSYEFQSIEQAQKFLEEFDFDKVA